MPGDELGGRALELADRIASQLKGIGRLGVAYSGGVDSAVLTALAIRALGKENVVALLGVSPSLAARERRLAHHTAEQIGVRVVEVQTREADNAQYRRNGVDRCYHCRTELFTRIEEETAGQLGLDAVAYGENADDALRLDRPGSQAAVQHRVLRPLAAAGATKADIRAIASAVGLTVAEKPASPCLASRIPHGDEVSAEKLLQIEQAEDVLLSAGFTDGRVRHHGDIARVEVPVAEFEKLLEPTLRKTLIEGIQRAGFRFVTFDLAGIQTGGFTLALITRGAS
jgi:uncharacterized protein